MTERPTVKLTGENGNIFNLMGIASKALERAGQREKAKEMRDKIINEAKSYHEAIATIADYVNIE